MVIIHKTRCIDQQLVNVATRRMTVQLFRGIHSHAQIKIFQWYWSFNGTGNSTTTAVASVKKQSVFRRINRLLILETIGRVDWSFIILLENIHHAIVVKEKGRRAVDETETTTTTTTTIYFNEVVFPSVLGFTLPMAFPQHSPPSWPVPSILPTKSLLSHIFSQHFSPSLPEPTFHSITIYLQCLNSLYPTQLISLLNMAKPSQPVPSHHFSNVINCQHAPHTLIAFPFT